jgi:hypothetical protein
MPLKPEGARHPREGVSADGNPSADARPVEWQLSWGGDSPDGHLQKADPVWSFWTKQFRGIDRLYARVETLYRVATDGL